MPKILANSLRAKDENGIWTDVPVVIKDDAHPTDEQIVYAIEKYLEDNPDIDIYTEITSDQIDVIINSIH